MHAQSLSQVQLFATSWTIAHQTPLSMGVSRQEYWSGLSFPVPGDPPDPGSNHVTCSSYTGRWILYHWATWEDMWLWAILKKRHKTNAQITLIYITIRGKQWVQTAWEHADLPWMALGGEKTAILENTKICWLKKTRLHMLPYAWKEPIISLSEAINIYRTSFQSQTSIWCVTRGLMIQFLSSIIS